MSTARTFESIVVIFNPNSTGDAPKLAEELKASLAGLLPYAADITLQPTARAGHAVELAVKPPAAAETCSLFLSAGTAATTRL